MRSIHPSTAPARLEMLGAQIHAAGMEEALAWIRGRIAEGSPAYVVTLNGALLVQASRDPDLRALINGAGLVTADGIGVIIAARILGVGLRERVAGVDLVAEICAEAARSGYRVFLLGGEPDVAEATAGAMRARWPDLRVVGTHHGFFGPDEERNVLAMIQQARPDLLLVAMGAPRQESWMRQWAARLGVPVAIGVGGSFDVLAGRVPRAPRWMQRAGLEWLYRTLREPWRWSVVRTIPPLFLLALRERWRRGPRPAHGGM